MTGARSRTENGSMRGRLGEDPFDVGTARGDSSWGSGPDRIECVA
ncbi:hypothetical protein [Lysobacter gummosus]